LIVAWSASGSKCPCSFLRALAVKSGQDKIYEDVETVRALEERVRQNDIIYVPHCRIIHEIFIYKKENRHVHFFSRQQFLFLEAEAFYFGKVRRNLKHTSAFELPANQRKEHEERAHLCRRNIISSYPNNIFIRRILRRVECQRCFSRHDGNEFLLRGKFPR